MDLSNLKPAEGSVSKRKRIGRGQGSGHGGTATKGNKGAQSRSGYKRKAYFEGGQMPIQRRVPKLGFKNINRVEYVPINLQMLQYLVDNKKVTEFNPEVFKAHGLISKNSRFKILGKGELNTKIKVEAHAFSASAKSAIEVQGGEVIKL